MTPRMTRPCRSDLLSATVSALELPFFARQLLLDVPLELAEVEIAAPDLGGAEILRRGVVLPRDVAEALHRALVEARQPLFALRGPGRRPHQLALEADACLEVHRRRRLAGAHVGLAVALDDDVAGVLQLRRLPAERPPQVAGADVLQGKRQLRG